MPPNLAGSQRPHPVPDEVSAPFWDAALVGQLAIQRCTTCGMFFHPPVVQCWACRATSFAWTPVSGRGRIRSFTRVHRPPFEVEQLVIAAVELEEQRDLLVVANILGACATVGMPVKVEFERLTETLALPQFRPIEDADARP